MAKIGHKNYVFLGPFGGREKLDIKIRVSGAIWGVGKIGHKKYVFLGDLGRWQKLHIKITCFWGDFGGPKNWT